MMIGLVGKPSSGKSSMFKAMTMIDVKISAVPFTTIKPNIGVGHAIVDCVCKEFEVACTPKHGFCRNNMRFVPVKLIDVAGLVPDAHKGRGMGNEFLSDLIQASALIHIVDTTGETDAEGNPGVGDPDKDIEFLEHEIDLWFASVIERALRKFERQIAKAGKDSASDMVTIIAEQLTGMQVKKYQVERSLSKVEKLDLKDKHSVIIFARELRRMSKPILVAANKIDLGKAQDKFNIMKEHRDDMIPTSAEAEIALKRAHDKEFIDYMPGDSFTTSESVDDAQKKALDFIKLRVLAEYGSTGVQQCLNRAVFGLLDNIVVYPVANSNKLTDKEGRVLPDAFIVPHGTTARELAYKVHTDIGDKFVCGVDVRTKRRLAADYELKNNDVIEIMTKK